MLCFIPSYFAPIKGVFFNLINNNPGGYTCVFLVGVYRPVLQIMILFQTKKCHFSHSFSAKGPVSPKSR